VGKEELDTRNSIHTAHSHCCKPLNGISRRKWPNVCNSNAHTHGSSAIYCVCCYRTGEAIPTQDLKPGTETETATLAWLVEALEYARSRGQTKVVGYLEEVADDVLFEVEMVARRTSFVG